MNHAPADGLTLGSSWAAHNRIDGLIIIIFFFLKKDTKFGAMEEGADLEGVRREEWGKYDQKYTIWNSPRINERSWKERKPKTMQQSEGEVLSPSNIGRETTYNLLSCSQT